MLKDTQSPQAVRLAALKALQSASFSVVKFTPCRPEYLAALRSLIDDPDPEVRQRVLGILAREQDGYTQQRLLEGLQQPEKALVSPEKALQLLSYDIHADAYPVAREIASKPPNPAAKREALRLLAADAASAPTVRGDSARQERAAGNTSAFSIGTPFPGAEKNAGVRARHCP